MFNFFTFTRCVISSHTCISTHLLPSSGSVFHMLASLSLKEKSLSFTSINHLWYLHCTPFVGHVAPLSYSSEPVTKLNHYTNYWKDLMGKNTGKIYTLWSTSHNKFDNMNHHKSNNTCLYIFFVERKLNIRKK